MTDETKRAELSDEERRVYQAVCDLMSYATVGMSIEDKDNVRRCAMTVWRKSEKDATAAATRATAERCALACDALADDAGDSETFDMGRDCAAACRKVGEA